jgi:hypothetical protein
MNDKILPSNKAHFSPFKSFDSNAHVCFLMYLFIKLGGLSKLSLQSSQTFHLHGLLRDILGDCWDNMSNIMTYFSGTMVDEHV